MILATVPLIETHIGIIDKEPIRLVTPLLKTHKNISEAYFLGDNTQIQTFEHIKKILTSRNIQCFFYEITSKPDINLLMKNLSDFTQYINKKNRTIIFNASCGLRLRLLSAYEVFKKFNWPTYIIELETNKICWMTDMPNLHILQSRGNISVNEWLHIFGAEVYSDQVSNLINNQWVENISKKWATNANELSQAFGVLNFLATTCRKTELLSVDLSPKQVQYIELKSILNDLESNGLITKNGVTITFSSEMARSFCNGVWLTELVYLTLIDLKKDYSCISDLSYNINFNRYIDGKIIKNKFDIASIINNKLFIIECKTKSMKDTGDDTLYKLDSLREFIGGVQSKSILISLKPLRTSDILRSTDLGIFIIGPSELPDLKNIFKAWLTLCYIK
jgi:hypothetical protein